MSVGWIGAVLAFLVLAIAGLRSTDPVVLRTAYPAMAMITWYMIVPLAIAALVTGLAQSLVTEWGLLRHYWVVAKLAITVLATVLLFLHTRPITRLAEVASAETLATEELRSTRVQVLLDAGGGLLALLLTTALSVYKPRGLTPYGVRKETEEAKPAAPAWVYLSGAIGAGLFLLVVFLHLTGRGLGGH